MFLMKDTGIALLNIGFVSSSTIPKPVNEG
jgi:hypothetical protein